MKGSRGFAFSFDAMLSVALLVFLVSSLSYLAYEKTTNLPSKRELQRNAEDALSILDSEGYLAKGSTNAIQSQLQQVMPRNSGWRLMLSQYEYKNSSFNLKEQKSIGDWAAPLGRAETVHGKRIYLVGGKGGVSRYAIAEYWAWLK